MFFSNLETENIDFFHYSYRDFRKNNNIEEEGCDLMVENHDKVYRDTMQEVMIELKLSTHTFLNKVKEKSQSIEKHNLEIPITVTLREGHQKFEMDVFGEGEELNTSNMLSNPNLKNIRIVNQNITIEEGITLLHGKKQFFREEGIQKPESEDYHYILFISKNVLNSLNVNSVSNWISEKILKKDCKMKINGVDVSNQEELQTVFRHIISINSS